jgi:hypothetical protein
MAVLSKNRVKRMTGLSGSIKMPKDFYQPALNSVQFGSKKLICKIIPIDGSEYQINNDLWEALFLPAQSLFKIEVSETTLRILPLVGLFTTPYIPGTQDPFGKDTPFYKKWLQMTADKGGVAYFFSRDKINWEEGTIRGLVFYEGYWHEYDFPFPDVVYDRLPNRKAEQLSWVTPLKDIFDRDYGIPWFNPGFFDKWDIYKLLTGVEELRSFLPQTALYSEKKLKTFLKKYPTVYLKPKDKSRGAGILRIDCLKEGGFSYRKSGETYLHDRLIPDWDHLIRTLSADLSSRLTRHYLIQQGISLVKLENRPFDFRIHTNKDKDGKWCVTAVAAKLAGPDQVTTHMAYGGDVRTLSDLFDKKNSLEKFHQLETVSLSICRALEHRMPGTLGELGFDIGLDQEGGLSLFEVNSKPRHHIFLTPAIRHQLKLVHHHWLDFCTHLAHLSLIDPEYV